MGIGETSGLKRAPVQSNDLQHLHVSCQSALGLEGPYHPCRAAKKSISMGCIGLEEPLVSLKVWCNLTAGTVLQEAAEFLKNHPLGDENPQMSVWNGGMGSEQKAWLSTVLEAADRFGFLSFLPCWTMTRGTAIWARTLSL